MKDYEFFKTYRSSIPPEIDLAWSDAFPGAAAWLADRERRRIERERDAPEGRPSGIQDGTRFGGSFIRD
jgi:hypothetical protein